MEKTYTLQSIKNRADVSKGQKIVAALYLVTAHLSDSDPLKAAIRSNSILLVQTEDRAGLVERITTLLGAAVLARVINEKNVSIIVREMGLYASSGTTHAEDAVGSLFDHDSKTVIKRTEHAPQMSFMSQTMSLRQKNTIDSIDNKSKRQNQILSFINDRKSASIKDISGIFTDVSEKTIQRELGALVASGKITKRGSKRWSIYLALPAAN